jgi:hypothetical protein
VLAVPPEWYRRLIAYLNVPDVSLFIVEGVVTEDRKMIARYPYAGFLGNAAM